MALPRDQNGNIAGGVPSWSCNYTQVESVTAQRSTIAGHFGITLQFYQRDANADKVVSHTFDCKEHTDVDDSGEENKAGENPPSH